MKLNKSIEFRMGVLIQTILMFKSDSGVMQGEENIAIYSGLSRGFVREGLIKLEARGVVSRSHGFPTKLIEDPFNSEEHY